MITAETLHKRVLNYCNDIISGKIKACKKHVWACQRFLRELNQAETDKEYPYYYHLDELYKVYIWARMFKHHKGELAGQPIELTDFQLFVVANLFCWKNKKGDYRRFKLAYIQLARKNAKSQLLAIIASYVSFLTTEMQECYISGWTREQSNKVYEQILAQINSCDFLRGRYKVANGYITHIKSGSTIKPLSKEARKQGEGSHGTINILDEYHTHPTSEIKDVLLNSTLGRPESLTAMITTAGDRINSPCHQEYEYASKIVDLDHPTDNDEYFALICELEPDDDVADEASWIKANPILATYENGIVGIRSKLKLALDMPEKMRDFKTKICNIWVDHKKDGYMEVSKWKACGFIARKMKDEYDLKQYPCYIGMDLSHSDDLTSLGYVFVLGEGKYLIKGHSFLPEDGLIDKMRRDNVRYDIWRDKRHLTATAGEVVDYTFVQQYIIDLRDKFGWNIREVCYDPWHAAHMAQNLQNDGFVCVQIPQRPSMLSLPINQFRYDVLKQNIIHDDNPIISWAVGNAVLKTGAGVMLQKTDKNSPDKIDPLAAIINAYTRARFETGRVDFNEMLTDEYLDNLGF